MWGHFVRSSLLQRDVWGFRSQVSASSPAQKCVCTACATVPCLWTFNVKVLRWLFHMQNLKKGNEMENMFSRCFCVKLSARFSEEVDFKQTYLGHGRRGHRSFLCLKFQMFSCLPICRGRKSKASWEEWGLTTKSCDCLSALFSISTLINAEMFSHKQVKYNFNQRNLINNAS